MACTATSLAKRLKLPVQRLGIILLLVWISKCQDLSGSDSYGQAIVTPETCSTPVDSLYALRGICEAGDRDFRYTGTMHKVQGACAVGAGSFSAQTPAFSQGINNSSFLQSCRMSLTPLLLVLRRQQLVLGGVLHIFCAMPTRGSSL